MNEHNPQPVDAALVPRFGAIPTFMRLPHVTDPSRLDIALIGVPWDGGTTNRAGARHGPREIRNMSSFMRKVHHVSRIAPYDLARIADLGDAPVNPIDLMDTLGRVEKFYAKVHAAGALPVSAGGDHLITLPIYRAIAKGQPIGMVHFDAHSDTNDRYFGDNKYTHGTPFRRAMEDGVLDPKRTIQIGLRGTMYDLDDFKYGEKMGVRLMRIEEAMELGPQKVMEIARGVALSDLRGRRVLLLGQQLVQLATIGVLVDDELLVVAGYVLHGLDVAFVRLADDAGLFELLELGVALLEPRLQLRGAFGEGAGGAQ